MSASAAEFGAGAWSAKAEAGKHPLLHLHSLERPLLLQVLPLLVLPLPAPALLHLSLVPLTLPLPLRVRVRSVPWLALAVP